MALLFAESFDGYGNAASNMTQWQTTPSLNGTGRTGTYCQKGVSTDAVRNITPATSTIILGFAYYWTLSGGIGWLNLCDAAGGTNRQCQVNFETTGKIRISRGWDIATLEQTAAAVLTANAWNAIEAKITIGPAGTWTLKCNGVTVLNGAGNTQGQATNAVGAFRIAPSHIIDNNGVDDLWLCDSSGAACNDFLGDCRIDCLTVQTGNGANIGLTPSTGTDHGALVKEVPANDDTNYTAGATAGVKDTYTFTDLTVSGTPAAVQASVRARKTNVAASQLAILARLASTDYAGATQALAGTTYTQYVQRWETRPSDSGSWTAADVNGAEFGVSVVAISAGDIRLTNLYVEVLVAPTPPAVATAQAYVWMPV